MQTSHEDPLIDRGILAYQRTTLANERTRLANQRTFSAWTRTGLASVGGGLAVVNLLNFEDPTRVLVIETTSGALIFLGVTTFALSLMDYINAQRHFKRTNGYAGATIFVTLMSVVLIIVSIMLFLISFRII